MSWKDFFYFSRGERQALVLLMGLIVLAGLLLYFGRATDTPAPSNATVLAVGATDTVAPQAPGSTPRPASGSTAPRATETRGESTSARIKRLTSPPPRYPKADKFEPGTLVELNEADTTVLKKIPGIGSGFANRIVKYRNLLGGFYAVSQLGEVYGIDADKYEALAPWCQVDASRINKLRVNVLPADSLRRHPYISYPQAKAIYRLRMQKKGLTGWENLLLLNEFTEHDAARLRPYLSFE